jgi:hypothetical protein
VSSTVHPLTCSVPQWSVLGPFGVLAYTEDLGDTVERHEAGFHQFADDISIYRSVHPLKIHEIKAEISDWCSSKRLQLNTDQIELIWLSSTTNLNKIASQDLPLHVGPHVIKPAMVIR